MSTTVVTPFSRSQAIELAGNLWRKKLLPVGTITYRGPGAPPEGRKIHFTREYLRGLAEAFRSRAYDQVPFQIAGDDNKHTNAVERYRGEILDLDLADDGLYCVARVTPGGEKILSENPNLGVSARIREDYARSDGEFFPAAIQHVLGTLDPHVPQLGPWQAVDLANSNSGRVIDLSGCQFDGEAGGGLSDAEMDTVLGRIGALQSAGLLGDDLAYIKAVMAEADAIEAAGLDYVEASNIASNIAGMTHQVATAAAMAGDFELAVNCYLDLSGQSAGSGSVELASRAPSGRFSGAT